MWFRRLHRQPGWFIILTCRFSPSVEGLARFRPAFRGPRALRPLQAHRRPNKRDIHVFEEYCEQWVSAVILVQRQLPRVAHKCARVVVSSALILTHLQTGGCARSLVAPTRRRATPILLAPSRARAHAAAPPAPCLLHGVARREDGAASPFTLCRARAAPGAKPCACVSHRLCIARLHNARRSDFSNLPPRRAAGLGWYA